MTCIRTQRPEPWWQPSRVDVGRRRALIGLSGLVVSAMGAEHAWAQISRSCLLTPEAGEGPFYLDPKLVRADITSGQPGAPLRLAMQVVRAGDCATLANARVDVWHADAVGLYSGTRSNPGSAATLPRLPSVNSNSEELSSPTRGPRAIPYNIPELVRWAYTTRPLQGLSRAKEVVASRIFFPDEITREVFAEWQPYREHVSKRRTFNDNDPIRQGVYSTVTRPRGSYTAAAVLVVASR